MNRDLKKTLILSLVVFFFSIFVIYEINEFKKEEEIKEVKDRVLPFGTTDVSSVEVNDFRVEKVGGHYQVQTYEYTDIAPKEKTDKWLSKALTLEGRELSEEGEEVEWEKFGFEESAKHDKASFVFEVNGEKSIWTVVLSNLTSFDGGSYLKVSHDKKDFLYSSESKWKKFFNRNPNTLRLRALFDWTALKENAAAASPVRTLTIHFDESRSYTLKQDEKQQWTVAEGQGSGWAFDPSKIEAYLDDLKIYQIQDFVNESSIENTAAPDHRLKITTENDKEYVLKVYQTKEQGVLAHVSFRPKVWIRLDTKNVESLFPELLDFRSFESALALNEADISSIDIDRNSESFSFQRESGAWKDLSKKPPKNKAFNGGAVFKLLDQLENLEPKRFLDPSARKNQNEIFSIILNYKDGADPKSIAFLDGEISCVKGQKEKQDCLILKSDQSFLAVEKKMLKDFMNFNFYQERPLTKKEPDTNESS